MRPEHRQIYQGDALSVMQTMDSESFDLIVTSPPYYALRDYGTATWEGGSPDCDHKPTRPTDGTDSSTITGGKHSNSNHGQEGFTGRQCPKCGAVRTDKQVGLESSPKQYVDNLVEIFREARRLLKPTGVLFVNLGDSYSSGSKGSGGKTAKQSTNAGSFFEPSKVNSGLPDKSLMNIPHRFAIAMQDDGWLHRDTIIWAKGKEYADGSLGLNPMPGSQKDRCTSAYEFIFMFTKQAKYYFDWTAIAEPIKDSSYKRLAQNVDAQAGSDRGNGGAKSNGAMKAVCFGGNKGGGEHGNAGRTYSGNEWKPGRAKDGYCADAHPDRPQQERDGRQFPNQGYLAMPRNVWTFPTAGFKGAHFAVFPPELLRRCILAGCPPKGWVLDPFFGSGTTGEAAESLARHWCGIELNPEYIKIAKNRNAFPCTFSGLYDD